MKTIIAGGRDITQTIRQMDECVAASSFGISEVVSGGATGIDSTGEWWAKHAQVPVRVFPADWKTHGRSAGPIRNKQMAEYADALILIWDGKSRGSASMLKLARDAGILVHERIIK